MERERGNGGGGGGDVREREGGGEEERGFLHSHGILWEEKVLMHFFTVSQYYTYITQVLHNYTIHAS